MFQPLALFVLMNGVAPTDPKPSASEKVALFVGASFVPKTHRKMNFPFARWIHSAMLAVPTKLVRSGSSVG